MIELATDLGQLSPHIVVLGVGGGGGNAVENMIAAGAQGVRFAIANTDAQALRRSSADTVIQLGRTTTGGLGAGSRPEVGKAAAEESLDEIREMLEGAHLCFLTGGLGGGTGTGAAPVIARAAREMGILTVAVVTTPFQFEGQRRARQAEAGLAELQAAVDTLVVVPNQNLFRVASVGTTFREAFEMADAVLSQGVCGITDLMTMPGLINLDFADVRTVMAGMGRAMLGTGESSGEDRALRAAEAAIANPLLDEAVKGARGLLVSITGGEDMRLMEVDEVASHVKDMVDPDADIIWGSSFRPELEGRIRVSIVATGLAPAAAAVPAGERAPVILPPVARPKQLAARPKPAAAPAPRPEAATAAAPTRAPRPEVAAAALRPAMPQLGPLSPPATGIEIPLVDPFAPYVPPAPPPRLFERMAAAARGAAAAGLSEEMPTYLSRAGERRIHA